MTVAHHLLAASVCALPSRWRNGCASHWHCHHRQMGRGATDVELVDEAGLSFAPRAAEDGAVLISCSSEEERLVASIREALSPDLLKPNWQGSAHPMAGHCYVASEALYHLLGGKEAGLKPQVIQHEGGPHWFLRGSDGRLI